MRESAPPPHPEPNDDASNVAATMVEWLTQCESFRIAVRDGEGRFVSAGTIGERHPDFFSEEERRGVIGATDWPTMRYIGPDGHELRRLDHPAHVARLTGQPQIGKLIGLRAPSGETKWFFGDYIPMRPSEAGYEVISVVMEATEAAVSHTRATRRGLALEALLDLAPRLMAMPTSLQALAAELKNAVSTILPRTHTTVARWDPASRSFLSSMITEQPGLIPVASSTPATADVRALLTATHVNNDVQLTDIYGTRVIGSDEVPARSICTVPVMHDGEVVGALGAFAQSAGYFNSYRVDLLERLAQLLGPALNGLVCAAGSKARPSAA
ncbi:MAG: GAF domain-containing protein [Dehalococcoidia bacterium]